MKNLKILSLANNPKLSQIPWNVTSKTLTRLNLSYTDVTFIPKDITGFSLLQHLNLTGTRLKTLELETIQLKELKLGYVEEIEKIDALFIELLEIANTDLRETNVTTLISKFPKLNQLILINIGLNQLVFPKILPELKSILLSKNNLTSFPWESISNQCNQLDLSNNEIEILGSPKFWSNIKWLNLKDNKIHTIEMDGCDFESFKHNPESDDIRFRKELNLQNNPIQALPIGFEKLEFITSLNISGVQIDNYDLENKLWKRLPQSLTILNISQIPVAILPCNINNNLSKLIANDCQLRWICPYISKNLTMLEITENPEIKSFPFVPDEVLFYPKNKLKAEIEEAEVFGNTLYDLDETFTFLTDYSFQDMKDANENYLNYTFKKIYENQPNDCCKCCSQCGEETDEPMVEELMTMDCNMYVKKAKIVESWNAEEWKIWVKTRLCETCIDTFKRESIKVNEEYRIKLEKMKEKEETKKRKSINNEENAVSSKDESCKKSPNPCRSMVPIVMNQDFNEQEMPFDNNHLTSEYVFPSGEQYQQVNDSSYYQQIKFVQQEVESTSSFFAPPAKTFPISSDHLHLPSHQYHGVVENIVDEQIPESSLCNYQTAQQMSPQQYYCAIPYQNEHQYVLANTTDSSNPALQLQQYQNQIPVNDGSNENTTLFNNLSLTQNQFSANNQYPVFLDNPPVNTDIQNLPFFPPYLHFNNSNHLRFRFPATFEQTQPHQPYSTPYQPYQQIQSEDNPPQQHQSYTYDPSEY
uniref:Leucine rich repeat protein n=1 Tax=Panagrolaimus sp. PS1159 TaxID=55785 RepID=A0AC35FA30_9BILA